LLVVGCWLAAAWLLAVWLVGYLVARHTHFLAPCFLLLLFRLLDARCFLLWLAACLKLPT